MATFGGIDDLFESFTWGDADHAPDSGNWHLHAVTLKVPLGPFPAGEKLERVFLWLSPTGSGMVLCRNDEDFGDQDKSVRLTLSFTLSAS